MGEIASPKPTPHWKIRGRKENCVSDILISQVWWCCEPSPAIPASLSHPLFLRRHSLCILVAVDSPEHASCFSSATFKTLVSTPASACCESFVGFPPSFLVDDLSSRPTRRRVVSIDSRSPRVARLCPGQSRCLCHVRCPVGSTGRAREPSVPMARASAPAACLHSHPAKTK